MTIIVMRIYKTLCLKIQAINNYKLLRRNKKCDYFTSALPWPQKGPSATLNFNSTANISSDNIRLKISPLEGNLPADTVYADYYSLKVNEPNRTDGKDGWKVDKVIMDNANLNIPPVSINELRQAFQLQRIFERDARVGTRYNEIIKGHFGVDVPDYRLQRSEYLGGGSSNINIQQVPQTSSTDSASPQGNMAAYGTQVANNIGFTRSFDEHGILLCLASVRIDNKYQYGLPRMYSRRSRFDYYLPSLAHLGEQAILNKEIFATGNPDIDEKVFGYQERFSELRYNPNRVSGKLRSISDQPLDFWHLAQKFDKTPMLNTEFIQSNPPLKRALAVQNEPEIVSDMYFIIECTRVMPLYSIPGGIDRF